MDPYDFIIKFSSETPITPDNRQSSSCDPVSYDDDPKIMTSRGMIFGNAGTRKKPEKNPEKSRKK
jgi:hypothetical protein